jgi:hypothetical protein
MLRLRARVGTIIINDTWCVLLLTLAWLGWYSVDSDRSDGDITHECNINTVFFLEIKGVVTWKT